LGGGAAIDADFVIPSPFDPIGEYENSTVSFFEINHGHQIKRFSIGYGLQFSKNNFSHGFVKVAIWGGDTVKYTGVEDTLDYDIIENRIGINLKTKFKITNFFQLGLNYMPSFINADNFHDFHYTHLGYFNLIVTINIKPSKKVEARNNLNRNYIANLK